MMSLEIYEFDHDLKFSKIGSLFTHTENIWIPCHFRITIYENT